MPIICLKYLSVRVRVRRGFRYAVNHLRSPVRTAVGSMKGERMQNNQGSAERTSQPVPGMKRTLNLTSLTVNAMALIAPGAFLWTTFQVQAAQMNGAVTTAAEMWTGLVAALVLAFLTALSYAELSDIYPKAGSGSSYYFAEAAFLDKEKDYHRQWARIAKFITGWISHLYYWIYPGIMVAFSATLIVYIFSLFGISLVVWEKMLAAAVFAVINGYIAYRGINGSTITSIGINAVQLIFLLAFSVLAILYRHAHPGLAYAQSIPSILLPHNFTNVIFQSTIAILLLVGFESVTAFGAEAINPKKDIRRAILLSLLIQGFFAYLFEYFAANYFVSTQMVATAANGSIVTGYSAAAASGAPIGDMIRIIGDKMLGGTGLALVLIMAVTVVLALVGTTLACLNTGVRITYAMSKDKELPSAFGLLHGSYATPQWGIWLLVLVSAIFGAYGVINVNNLTQITLASNTGTFLIYGMTNLIALVAFWSRPGANFMKHRMVPLLGFLANLLMLIGVVVLSFKAGGSTSKDTIIALAMVVVWVVVGLVWFVMNTRRQGHPMLVRESKRLTTADVTLKE
jgi:APA family basic amino acid/polyamine antiporter